MGGMEWGDGGDGMGGWGMGMGMGMGGGGGRISKLKQQSNLHWI